jgi:GT2 family glycosyltransferase
MGGGAAAERADAAGSGPPLVSVVVSTRDRADSLGRLLASLARQSYPRLETIVYDDASDPPVAAPAGATVIRGKRPRGACFGRNRCFEAARGEFVLTLDDDTELVDPELVSRAVGLARRHPDVGMLVFREERPDGPSPNAPAGPDGQAFEIARPAFYGCLIRAEALRRVGMYLVEEFGYYMEEVELAIRMLDAGFRTVYVPWLALLHHEDVRGRDLRRIYRLTARNTLLTALLRYPLRDVPRGLAGGVRMFLKRPPVDGRRDWAGLAWIAAELVAKVRYVARNRAPVRHATLLRHRALARRPEPVALARAGAGAGDGPLPSGSGPLDRPPAG